MDFAHRSGVSILPSQLFFHIPHRLVISPIIELPFGQGKKWLTGGPLSWIACGWQLSGIVGSGVASDEEISLNKAPAKVRATIEAHAKGAKIEKVEITTDESGKKVYDVEIQKDGKIVSHEGAWLYGIHTDQIGVLMPGKPKVGDKFQAENVPKITWENDEVVSVNETVTVPAGRFTNCVKVREKLSDKTTESKYLAPGVGVIKEADGADERGPTVVLTKHRELKASK